MDTVRSQGRAAHGAGRGGSCRCLHRFAARQRYTVTQGIDNVSFELQEGEVHCLVGENGAGKSTLTKLLSGAITPESGTLVIQGVEYQGLSPRQAIELGVSTVYQEAELIESLTVADNIFLGEERAAAFPLAVDTRHQNENASDAHPVTPLHLKEDALVEDLSSAQKQMLQIVKALHRDAKIIIMDEPTSSLGPGGDQLPHGPHPGPQAQGDRDHLHLALPGGDIRDRRHDHHPQGWGEHGDVPVAQIDIATVIRKMVGRDASLFYSKETVDPGPVQVELRHLSRRGFVEDVSFDVRSGEVFGIGGLVGSGRSELVNLIFGADRRDGGEILINGRAVTVASPARRGAGRHLSHHGGQEEAGHVRAAQHHGEHRHRAQRALRAARAEPCRGAARVREMVQKLRIAVTDEDTQTIAELSGGNQQKAIIGRWLLSDATLYIFDEPTKGVDVGARAEIFGLIVELAKNGKSIIMVSSDMPELMSMSDRIGVMRAGRLTHVLDRHGVTEEMLIKHFIGV